MTLDTDLYAIVSNRQTALFLYYTTAKARCASET